MATYKGIQGYTVQKLSSDPPAEQSVGQLWYNSSTWKFKIGTEGGGAWASGTAMPTATHSFANAGITTACVVFNGAPIPKATSFEFNGTAWTAGNATPGAQAAMVGMGTQTAAFGAGGYNPSGTYSGVAIEYDGTCFSAQTADPANSGAYRGCAGTQTAALTFGGYGGPGDTNVTSEYDGSAWTTGGTYPLTKRGIMGAGSQTAAVGAGASPGVTTSNKYDGSTWTATGSLNTGRHYGGSGGTQTSAMVFGGVAPGNVANTETFDGTSWTEENDLSTAVKHQAVGWSNVAQTSGMLSIGGQPPPTAAVEVWTNPVYTIKTVTVS